MNQAEVEQFGVSLLAPTQHVLVDAALAAHGRVVEERARERPELWLWLHERWKRGPG